MTFIPAKPVLHRELLVAARSKQTHRLRFFMGLIALVGIAVSLVVMSHMTVAAGGGKKLLAAASTAAYLYCLTMGFSLTLGSIRDERDQGTLSLLFLTSLRGGQIVFAKLFARSLRTFEGLLAILPVFALCLLLGGVTMAEFTRVGLALINTLFVSACLGMYISTKRLQLTAAAFLAGTLAFALGVVAPFLANLLIAEYRIPGVGWVAGGITPWFPLQVSLDSKQPLEDYWPMLAGSFLTGAWFLAAAIRSVRNNWQDKPNQTKKLRRLKEFQNWDFKSASRDPKYRAELLDQNPICWLNSRDRFRSTGYWVYFALIYGLLAFAWAMLGRYDSPLPFFWVAVLMFDFGIWAKLNQAAGIQLIEERKLGSLEMILCAPVGLPRILSGLWMALRKQFGRVLLASTTLNFLLTLLIVAMHSQDRHMARDAAPSTIFWVFIYYTMANISLWVALSWVGMWFGLRNKPDSSMSSFGLVRVLARPWFFAALAFVVLFIAELAGVQIFKHFSSGGWVFACAFCIVASNFLYVLKAKARIPQAFQLAATGTLDEPLNAVKERGAERRSGESLLVRLWRRKVLRWVVPAAVIVLCVIGNRWRLNEEYDRRLTQLRAAGVPVARAQLVSDARDDRGRVPKTPITKVYQLAAANRAYLNKALWRASERLESLEAKAKESRADDIPHLKAFVASNANVMVALRSALDDDGQDFACDHYRGWPHFIGLHGLNEKIHWAVIEAVHERRIEEAVDLIVLGHRHQRRLDEVDLLHTFYYRMDHCVRLVKQLSLLLSADQLNHSQLQRLQAAFSQLLEATSEVGARKVDIRRAYWIEDLQTADPDELMEAVSRQRLSRIPPLDRNRFRLQALFGGTSRLKLRLLDSCDRARDIIDSPGPDCVSKLQEFRELENGAGLARVGLRRLADTASQAYRQVFLLRLCLTAVTAERYRLDHDGKRPETVEELYPLYLKTIPVNPIDGKPLLIEASAQGCRVLADSQLDGWIYRGPGGAIKNRAVVIER